MGVFNLTETVEPSQTLVFTVSDTYIDPDDWYYVFLQNSSRFGAQGLLPSSVDIEVDTFLNISDLVTDPTWDWSFKILSVHGFYARDQYGDRGVRVFFHHFHPRKPEDENDFTNLAQSYLLYQLVAPATSEDLTLIAGSRPRPLSLNVYSQDANASRSYLSLQFMQRSPIVLDANGEMALEFSKQLKPRKA